MNWMIGLRSIRQTEAKLSCVGNVNAAQQSMHPTWLLPRPPSLYLAWRVSPLLSLILSHAGNTAVRRKGAK